ncbi:MAG TPA: glycine--tRNA ligase subunit beta [Vicinamibacterales bacterium]|nr:glycine--tRNA ligase subunit beta [Vicinamibacterales bacterium]
MDRELLLEIGVEELPADWLPGLTTQLREKLQARLKEMRLVPDAPVESFSTPRRLTARIDRMPERQEDLDETVTGPPVSAAFTPAGDPTPAALGFARKQGMAFEALERVKTDKGEYLAAKKHFRGKSTVDALPDLLGALLRDLTFPKQMHWDAMLEDGKGELVFGRPIRWLLYLYGGRVVPFTIARMPNAAGAQVQEITTGAVTYGHRFLATSGRAGRSVKVRTFDDYRARLPEHFVILEHADRRDRIGREIEAKARKLGGRVHLREHAALLDTVADLVEYPGVVAGFFGREFLALPQEVLTTTLVHHQHYFPVVSESGALKEAFLAVVNTQPSDERLIARNAERVVAARLRDAKFFWDEDRGTRLEDRRERLDTIVFHKKLGSYRDKADRLETLARTIAADVFGAAEHADHAARAARLAKSDLATAMVFEFPELQGIMGGVYAREEGLPEPVWKAIYYQYLPIGVEPDAPPHAKDLGAGAVAWAALALADKLDSFAALTKAGERATGSRDPFGLRRQMQGVVRILMDLPELTGIDREIAISSLAPVAAPQVPVADSWDPAGVIGGNAHERIRFALQQRGFSAPVIRSAVSTSGTDNPLRARRIAEALKALEGSADLSALAVLFKRVKNIARELNADSPLDRGVLDEPAEKALLAGLDAVRPRVEAAVQARDYRRALAEIASLRPAVDRFFTEVFVMADDARLRTARLKLMADLRDLALQLADISELAAEEGKQS